MELLSRSRLHRPLHGSMGCGTSRSAFGTREYFSRYRISFPFFYYSSSSMSDQPIALRLHGWNSITLSIRIYIYLGFQRKSYWFPVGLKSQLLPLPFLFFFFFFFSSAVGKIYLRLKIFLKGNSRKCFCPRDMSHRVLFFQS